MKRDFVASVIVVKEDKILMVHHKKLNTWLIPGGHIDLNEIPVDAAVREVKEETGLQVKIISHENIWFDSAYESQSIKRPYAILLENIPEHKNQKAHQHIDMIYLAIPISGKEIRNLQEINDLNWFGLDEIKDLPEKEIFPELKLILCELLSKQTFTKISETNNKFILEETILN